MKDNKIMESLERLEKVGADTTIVTQKLKEAVETLSKQILETIYDSLIKQPIYSFVLITDSLYYSYWNGTFSLYWDYDGSLSLDNAVCYELSPDNGFVSRIVALDFAKAVSSGLLGRITKWLDQKKAETEAALKDLNQ
jgi:hypothetical protein